MTLYLRFFPAILLFVSTSLKAQLPTPCPSGTPQSAPSCNTACVGCNFDLQTGTTADNMLAGNEPPFCGNFENPEWYSFVASATQGNLVLAANNCLQNYGLEVAVYASCGGAPIACSANPDLFIELPLTGLVVGVEYLIVVDGYFGDQCGFDLFLEDGLGQAPAVINNATIQGSNFACPEGTNTYCVDTQNISNANYITWFAPFGALINGLPSPAVFPLNEGACVQITFSGVPGLMTIKAQPGNACVQSAASQKVVTVQPIPQTILPPLIVPFEDTPYFHDLSATTIPAIPGTYQTITVLTTWQGCDSIVRQAVVVVLQEGEANCVVFWDSNNNGVKEPTEVIYPFGLVLTASNGTFASSGPDGLAVFQNLMPGDTIFAPIPPPGLSVNPAFMIYQYPGPPYFYPFGLYPAPNGTDLNTVVSSGQPFRPGFNTKVNVQVNNPQGYQGTVTVQVVRNSWLEYVGAMPSPNLVLGDTLVWFTNLSGNNFSAMLTCETPIGTPLGTPVTIQSFVTIVPNDNNPYNNSAIMYRTVVGSYDPNDKQVWPQYLTPDLLDAGTPLTYTIRFQNTGTFPAEFVILLDTLQASVDPSTFQFVTSSHPCTWKMSGQGVVEFLFDPINLPDSLSDPEGSQGFVTFTVKPREGTTFGDEINNFADIYFDFNPPIRTNTANTRAVYFVPGDGLAGQGMRVRPNPAAFHLRCAWTSPTTEDGTLRLISLDGIPRLTETVPAGESTWLVDVQNLNPGLYLAVLEAGSTVYVKQVVVIRAPEVRGWR